jgi:hypothetical protein
MAELTPEQVVARAEIEDLVARRREAAKSLKELQSLFRKAHERAYPPKKDHVAAKAKAALEALEAWELEAFWTAEHCYFCAELNDNCEDDCSWAEVVDRLREDAKRAT